MKENINKLVNSRFACRQFNDKPLDKETVLEIARLSTLSPSACNSQPWKMLVVCDEEKRKQAISALTDLGHNTFLDKAKALIVLTEQQAKLKEFVSGRFDRTHFVKYDIGELTAYITLIAKSYGVDSCIIGWINQEKLRASLGYSEDEVCNIIVALGYSDLEPTPKKRKPYEETIRVI